MPIKIHKEDCIKLKSICTAKENEKMTKWVGEHIDQYISDKGLISKIYKTQHQKKNPNQHSIKKWANDLNRHFSKKGIQMTK